MTILDPSQPPTLEFTANPTAINPGESSILTWSITNAASVSASGGWSGSKALSGSETVSPTANSVSASVAVTVYGTSPFSLSASPAQVSSGDTITVTWTAPRGETSSTDWIGMYLQGDPNGKYKAYQYTGGATEGSLDFTAPSTDGMYEFRYLLRGSYTDVATSNAVTVGSFNPPPTLTLDASPLTIDPGQSSTLTWSSTDATSVTASGGWSGSKALSGSETVSPTANTTYTLTATGPGGSVSQSVTVTVNGSDPVPTLTLSANPLTIDAGQSSTLTWSSTDAT
ncbi:MAG: hypothetical protein JRI96_15295, partial [Deltaproteobacteria bacterium]|nr:hypothetical protein [Deltaproteobacteria bacterium]